MLLGERFPMVHEFVAFLQEKKPVRVINRDQWQSFLEFAASDISNYDESSACTVYFYYIFLFSPLTFLYLGPVLFDEFVDWKRGH